MNQISSHFATAILVIREGRGHAETELQKKLIGTYLRLLDENLNLPGAICFYADAVKLVVEGSPVLEMLQSLETKGVHRIICQTCINYFQLTDKVRVGIIGGMPDILAAQWKAEKVTTL